jgi:hypothetical protein
MKWSACFDWKTQHGLRKKENWFCRLSTFTCNLDIYSDIPLNLAFPTIGKREATLSAVAGSVSDTKKRELYSSWVLQATPHGVNTYLT